MNLNNSVTIRHTHLKTFVMSLEVCCLLIQVLFQVATLEIYAEVISLSDNLQGVAINKFNEEPTNLKYF